MKTSDTNKISKEQLKYLKLLSKDYPNRGAASTRIINLQAILNLPKGTEHFLSDIHGEHEPFFHVLKNGSGVIKNKIESIFDKELTSTQIKELATLVYYPAEIIDRRQDSGDISEFYEINLYRLIRLTKVVTAKYTRTQIREALPKEFAFIIEELLHDYDQTNSNYYSEIIKTVIELDRAAKFIVALAELIQRFAIAHLHIIGDIYDRGSGAHFIMDRLERYHSLDIQWGNHDIVWMAAAAGSLVSIASVIRVSLRYANIETLEEGYGVSLRPLSVLAKDYYDGDPCRKYKPKIADDDPNYTQKEKDELAMMHKAIAIIQFKLEAQLISKNPQWGMQNRTILEAVDLKKGVVTIDGVEHPLNDTNLPTFSVSTPYELNESEQEVIAQLQKSFLKSEKLQKHTKMLFDRGSVYAIYNNNLLYHGCIPMNEDGSFMSIAIDDDSYKGRELLEVCDTYSRLGYFSHDETLREFGQGVMWYLWAGKDSPLFGKEKMATFESYFIDDKSVAKEAKNWYYNYRDKETSCIDILSEFGLGDDAKIINGHVPVKVKKGESPIKSGGKLVVIDGGFSKAYQGVTGIAGYTLIYNSQGMSLVSHGSFKSTEDAIENGADIVGSLETIEKRSERFLVRDSDEGKKLSVEVDDLKELFEMYSEGIIKEH
ncbi:MAG: fructose-1,6-bisphosphatase [Campylobacterota bacterium]|nr:fructose-1,6-bisphosphatase [Campylobacterota bacterium]